ncbi:MAG TPA: ABC transporter permease [Chloroflexi bacterium]|jgi:ABC-type spermidine/putrescine transport system permease subunit I|nr:ABC transporter permease [Chloroflexota bacterium]HBY44843.1 ABC transporter permease [Chloroflexota bacterium]HCG30356.1 ABC transporter permease [Chloroflexota bacterium]
MTAPGDTQPSRIANARALARQRRGVQLRYLALVLPIVLYLAFFYGYPVLAMLFRSVSQPTWTLDNFAQIFQESIYVRVIWITVQISLVVTIVTLFLAYPLAYLLASISSSRANLLMILVLVPFWSSILVRTYAWMVLLGRFGIINNFLIWIGAIDEPLRLLNTRLAVYIAMVQILMPFMVLPLYSVMRGIDRNLMRAAEGLGARPDQVFRRIFFPLSLPGIAAGCLLVFILSLGFFITPALVGGPRDVMISVLIEQQVNTLLNWPFASALAAVLLIGALGIFTLFNRILGVENIFGGTSS